MRYLIDTNIFIAAEPVQPLDLERGTPAVAELMRLFEQGGHRIFVHPASREDIQRDSDQHRRHAREILFGKYVLLEPAPPSTPQLLAIIGETASGTRDSVDHALIAALDADAVDCLITEDRGLRQKAVKAGFATRVSTVAEGIASLRSLFETTPLPPPAVTEGPAYLLNEQDPIFQSLRTDYQPDFNDWLQKCKREHRKTWFVQASDGRYAGLCIVKPEQPAAFGISGKALKLCTLKTSDDHRGFRFGELLLKSVFGYAFANNFNSLYLTAFPKYENLIALLEDFGFFIRQRNDQGELVLVKDLAFDAKAYDSLSAIDFNIRYGPYHLKLSGVAGFIVPIQPTYHYLLFPDAEMQLTLSPGQHPFGNSIRKAYLCLSPTRKIEPGSPLLFYRSQDQQAVHCVGVAEDTIVSNNPEEIARFVSKRTVYRFSEIQEMCKQQVLCILFRHARTLERPIPFAEMIKHGLIKSAPQAITQLSPEALAWIRARINE